MAAFDLESIMRDATAEVTAMTGYDPTEEEIPELVPAAEPVPRHVPEFDLKNISMDTINSAMAQLGDNPAEMTRMMEEAVKNMTPEQMEQAKNLAGGQGRQLTKAMQKKGIDPFALRKQIQKERRAKRGQSTILDEDMMQVLIITETRQLKSKLIPAGSLRMSVSPILKTDAPVELSCSRLAYGPLQNKIIKVWYDPKHPGRNRRTTKIIGFPVGGSMVIYAEGYELEEAEFLQAEKFLI